MLAVSSNKRGACMQACAHAWNWLMTKVNEEGYRSFRKLWLRATYGCMVTEVSVA